MKLLTTSALSALVLCPFPALALDFGGGFSLTGDVELEYFTEGSGDDSTFGFVDLTLGWRSQSGGGLGFGADLALVQIEDLDGGVSGNAIWGGLVLTTGFGEFTVGNPRPLLKTMIDSPYVGGLRTFDLELSSLTGSSLETLLVFQEGVDSYGVSFMGGSDALTYGASYHALSQGPFDADVLELALTYQLGKTRIQAGAEVVDTPSFDSEKLLIGATYEADRWSAGLMISSFSQGTSDIDSLKLWGDYSVTEALTLGAQVMSIDGSSSQTLYGITGEYGFGAGGFAELGILDSDSSGSDAIYQASVGYRF